MSIKITSAFSKMDEVISKIKPNFATRNGIKLPGILDLLNWVKIREKKLFSKIYV